MQGERQERMQRLANREVKFPSFCWRRRRALRAASSMEEGAELGGLGEEGALLS